MSALSTAILARSPKAYWRLNDAHGASSAADSSGNAHTGTYKSATKPGMPGLAQAIGIAARFDGTGSGNNGITAAAHADFNTTTMSFVCAVRMDQMFQGINFGVWSRDLGAWNPRFKGATGKQTMSLCWFNGSTNIDAAIATVDVTDTHLWHLCIWTVAGAYTTAKLYLDGVDVTGALTTATPIAGTAAPAIGADFQAACMQDVAFFNTQLSSSDVSALYSAFQTDNTISTSSVFFGLHNDCAYEVSGTIDSQIATDFATHAKVSRNTIRWEVAQPTGTGAYDWTIHDEIVKKCNANGIIPWFIFSGTPTAVNGGSTRTAVPGTGVDATFQTWVTKCQTFIGDFVDRYKPGGSGPYTIPSPFYIELWNEPNLGNTTGPTGFWVNTAAGGPDANQYAYWYRNVRSTILAHYAGAKVVMAGLSSFTATSAPNIKGETFLRNVIGSAQWSGAPIDFSAYHPYSNGDNPDDATAFQNHYNDMLTMRCVLAELGYTPPLFASEVGASDATSQADQATKIGTMMTRVRDEWSPFCPGIIVFCDSDSTQAHYGLYTSMPSDGSASVTPKTAASTFESIAPAFSPPALTGAIPYDKDNATTVFNKLIALGYSNDEATRMMNQWTHES